MKIVGEIKRLKEINFNNLELKKIEMILTTDETYPQDLLIIFREDKCKLLKKFKIKDKVILSVLLKGIKWYNSVEEIEFSNEIQCNDIIKYNLNENKIKTRE